MPQQTATMDFFAHQASAKRRTGLLVLYYFIAVGMIIMSVYAAFAAVFLWMGRDKAGEINLAALWQEDLFAWVVGCTILVVVFGSLYKIIQLSSGGKAVAEMLGGQPVGAMSDNPDQRKLINVVEEMAIASGMPVPAIYVMWGEPGINAFAAGFKPDDAVICVTEGAIQKLSRDELQGVVAHEFSHILNGDMRINIKLTGILHGILLISLIGYWTMRVFGRSSGRSSKKGGAGAIVLLGLLVWIIGSIGVFFGNLIKSAVSRQREFLADASAVQFTRYPAGIAGALARIMENMNGSLVQSSSAGEASHFFFANGIQSAWFSLLATHPPLDERIKRIDPEFKGDVQEWRVRIKDRYSSAAGEQAHGFVSSPVRNITPAAVVASIGNPGQEHIGYAASILAGIPADLAGRVRDPSGARAVMFALLLSADESVRAAQMKILQESCDEQLFAMVGTVASAINALSREYSLPLMDLAIFSLKSLSAAQYKDFQAIMDKLVDADAEVDLFEYTMRAIVRQRLEVVFSGRKIAPIRHVSQEDLNAACISLLSCLAYWGADELPAAQAAFMNGVDKMAFATVPAMSPLEQCGLPAIDKALATLKVTPAMMKRKVLEACVACIGSDNSVTAEEAQLIRAVSDSLDCPMPPILASPAKV